MPVELPTRAAAPRGRAAASASATAVPVTAGAPPAVIRVASVPADHVYVRHLADPDGPDGVVRLPEPRRDGPTGSPWWPSPLLDASWVRANAGRFDLVHVHFGFDAVAPAALRAFVDSLAEIGRPLVVTVHDLRNPHHHDRRAHDAALDILVPAAAEVVTLTAGAADQLARRFGRRPVVLPHPHVVELGRLEALADRGVRSRFTVGIHLKSVRANMFTLDLVDVVADALAPLPDAVLRVDVHAVVDDAVHHAYVAGLVPALRARAATGAIDVRIHPFFTDEELWAYLASLDVSVLPYRFGTHSGWLEACADLGTTVIAPRCGWYHHQQPVLSYASDDEGFDAAGLFAAVSEAYRDRPRWRADPAWRRWQRVAIARGHRDLYERALRR
ncbi:MAG: glycosyltransferase family 1 protein [Acidimicrobiales bacterium]